MTGQQATCSTKKTAKNLKLRIALFHQPRDLIKLSQASSRFQVSVVLWQKFSTAES